MSNITPTEGAVHSTETCPHCSDKDLLLQTHASGEQVGSCGRCGYAFVRRIVLNDKGEPLLDFNEKPQYVGEATDNPYGAVHIVDTAGNAQMYAVATEEEMLQQIMPYIAQYQELIAEATLSRWRFGQYEITNLLNPQDHGNTGQSEDNVH